MIYKIEQPDSFIINARKNLDGTYAIDVFLPTYYDKKGIYYMDNLTEIPRGIISIDCLTDINLTGDNNE